MKSILANRLTPMILALLLTAGGVGAAQLDKSVTLSVDGQTRAAHVFGSTVGDLLESEGINLQPGDVVVPAADAALSDGDTIAVKYSRPLTVNVDGHVREARIRLALPTTRAVHDRAGRADRAKPLAKRPPQHERQREEAEPDGDRPERR